MKVSLISLVVLTALVGCSKQAAPDESNSESNINIPVVTPGANNELPPGSTPPTKKVDTPSVTPGAVTTHATPPQAPANRPTMPKRENPNAGPPKAGEQVADNFKVVVDGKTVEVEGICKLTEDEAICWKPNGDGNESLATELTNAIKSKTDGYSNQFQFKFMKKNRILVLKTTTPPSKPGQSGSYSYGGLMDQMYGGPEFVEGWTNNSSIFNQTSSTGFDQTRVERQVLTGAFNRETKTFPLRYQFTSNSQDRETVAFRKGQFTVDGNTYEITSISDKNPSGTATTYYVNGGPQKPIHTTWVSIKAVKITNPYAIAHLSPADDSGAAYGGLDDKGNPISQADFQKLQMEEQRKMMEASRAGKPYSGPMSMTMNRYVGSITLDMQRMTPNQNNSGGEAMTFVQAINVEASKIKKLSVNKSRRTVYVFDKVKLDKN